MYKIILSFFVILGCQSTDTLTKNFKEIDQSQFVEIDNHALKTPPSEEVSITKLSKYLTSTSKNDLEKTRAIYRWITDRVAYDTKSYFNNSSGDISPDKVLKSKIAVCEGYANLFSELAKEAGLQTEKINGFSKGLSYFPGKKFTKEDHAWNAVKIDGEWRLLDSTWSSGVVNGKDFKKDFNDFYFMTLPEKFLNDHLPSDSKWQLVSNTLTPEEFSVKVKRFPSFYKFNFNNVSPDSAIIESNDYEEITFDNPNRLQIITSLDNFKQNSFVKQEGSKTIIELRSPGKGSYELKVFSKQKDETGLFPIVLQQKINFQKEHSLGQYPEILDTTKLYIETPKEGKLKSGKKILFSMKVFLAKEIAFVDSSKEWKKFSPNGDDSKFSGEVLLEEGPVNVFANYGGDSWPLIVKYIVVK
jgi:transglutaminase-like putative cysteine protease